MEPRTGKNERTKPGAGATGQRRRSGARWRRYPTLSDAPIDHTADQSPAARAADAAYAKFVRSYLLAVAASRCCNIRDLDLGSDALRHLGASWVTDEVNHSRYLVVVRPPDSPANLLRMEELRQFIKTHPGHLSTPTSSVEELPSFEDYRPGPGRSRRSDTGRFRQRAYAGADVDAESFYDLPGAAQAELRRQGYVVLNSQGDDGSTDSF